MNLLTKYPFLKFLFPLIAGIIFGIYLKTGNPLSYYYLIILLVIALGTLIFSQFSLSYRFRWVQGILIALEFILLGYYLTINNYDNLKPTYFANFLDKPINKITDSKPSPNPNPCLSLIQLSEPIQLKAKSVKAIVKVICVKKDNQLVNTTGKAIIYFAKDSITKALKYGDRLIVYTAFKEIPPPKTPDNINYKKYFAFKNIYHEAYVKSRNLYLCSRGNGNIIFNYAYLIRDKFLSIFKQNNISGKELAVGSAIIFGYRDLLDADTIMEYSQAGVIHILCVAGLNVGIIYLIFANLLFFLDRFKHGKLMKSILLLLIIWSYTFICGLTPCILRASVMFTFITIGKMFRREVDTLNAVIVSAFILLLFNPFLITNLGFQHSYFAVIGIVILYPHINKQWTPVNLVILKIWELFAVSLSAQTLIFPLVIYYYRYFPDYFVFTNLIVIPLVFLITYAGIIILAIYPIAGVVKLFSFCFIELIKLLNYIIKSIENAPLSVIKPITVNSYELLLIYIALLFLLIAFINRNKRYFKLSLLAVLMLAIMISYKSISTFNTKGNKGQLKNNEQNELYQAKLAN